MAGKLLVTITKTIVQFIVVMTVTSTAPRKGYIKRYWMLLPTAEQKQFSIKRIPKTLRKKANSSFWLHRFPFIYKYHHLIPLLQKKKKIKQNPNLRKVKANLLLFSNSLHRCIAFPVYVSSAFLRGTWCFLQWPHLFPYPLHLLSLAQRSNSSQVNNSEY